MAFPTSIFLICLALFLTASVLFLLGFRQGQVATLSARWGHIAFASGCLLTSFLSIRSLTVSGTDQGHLHLTALLFATSIGWTSIIGWFVWNLRLIGAFTSPLIAIVLMVDAFFSVSAPGADSSQNLLPSSPLLKLHIATAIIGMAFAIGACGASLMLLWQERKLKRRQLNQVPVTYPAMDSLTGALASSLWLGFLLLTVSLLTGAIIVQNFAVADGFSITGKSSWALLVWGWYLTILVLKNILSYRPHRIAQMSLIGFALLALSWFGMAFTAISGVSP